MTPFPTTAPVDPTRRSAYRLLRPLEPARVRVHAALAGFLLRHPRLGDWVAPVLSMVDLVWGEIVYAGWPSSQAAMWRERQKLLGDDFPAFRAVVHCRAADVEGLIERTPASLRRTHAFVAQPAQADLLSPGTFLFTEGPGHDRLREALIGRVMRQVPPGGEARVDEWLRAWRASGDFGPDAVEGVLTRSAHRLLVGVELDDAQVADALAWQRTFFSPVMFAPRWARASVLRSAQRRLDETRARLEATYAGLPIDAGLPKEEWVPMVFEVLNLNAAAIQSLSQRVLRVLSERPDLQDRLRAEHRALGLDPARPIPPSELLKADLTERLVMEVLRLHTRVTTVQWRSDAPFTARGREWPAGTLRCANLATANTDPAVFPDPLEIRLDRDYARFLNFNGITSPRTCPGRGLAIALLARFVVHALWS
jgi:cytochrome P450